MSSRVNAEIETELGGLRHAASLRLAGWTLATKGYSGAAASMARLYLIGSLLVIGFLAQRENTAAGFFGCCHVIDDPHRIGLAKHDASARPDS